MNNEIKEILDNLKYTAKKHTIQILENGGKIEHCPQEIATELRLNTYSANILLDYITNLQEKVKLLTTGLEATDKAYKNYKSRNEKAIEILHNINDTLPLDLILNEVEHSEYVLQGEDKE